MLGALRERWNAYREKREQERQRAKRRKRCSTCASLAVCVVSGPEEFKSKMKMCVGCGEIFLGAAQKVKINCYSTKGISDFACAKCRAKYARKVNDGMAQIHNKLNEMESEAGTRLERRRALAKWRAGLGPDPGPERKR